jgi:hypothetical protein
MPTIEEIAEYCNVPVDKIKKSNRKAPNEHTKVMTKNQLKTEDNELMAAAIA